MKPSEVAMKVSVIGQGYVGLPLSITLAESGFNVVGIDSSVTRVDMLNLGKSFTDDIANERIIKQIENKKYSATTEFTEISNSKIVMICVPTPLDNDKKPDLSHVLGATSSLAKYLNSDSLVILESTVEPGTTRDILLPLISKISGLSSEQILLAYSPERIDPLSENWNVSNTPKIVAGINEKASKQAYSFYAKFVSQVTLCESVEIAEAAKLLENTFRFINISFINEFSMFCNKLGIDVLKVLSAAATKPYGFMPFYPGVGVGGHCIPVDPIYLAHKSNAIGAKSDFIELSKNVNDQIPEYIISRAVKMIGDLYSKKIIILGVAYKPNISDVRESPVANLIDALRSRGADVNWHDDLVKDWQYEKSTELSSNFDLAIIATRHEYFDLYKLGNVPILDTRSSI
jgi:UDP-N-acetyl-D-glucosamine dehydrogenase